MRRAALLVATLAIIATQVPEKAVAVPSPGNSTIPASISVVGRTGAMPDDITGGFDVVVRDLTDIPIANASVLVDFSHDPEIWLSSVPALPGLVVDCMHRSVRGFTNAAGTVHFLVLGGSRPMAPLAMPGMGAEIFADGVLLSGPHLGTTAWDLDGVHGVFVNDLSICLGDYGAVLDRLRSDYDHDGRVGINDLSLLFGVFGSGRQVESAPAPCP